MESIQSVPWGHPALWAAVGGALAGALLTLAVVAALRRRAGSRLAGAAARAETLLRDARRESEALRKAALLEGREELLEARAAAEREAERRRRELDVQEKRLAERDATLDRRLGLLERKDAELAELTGRLAARGEQLERREAELAGLLERGNERLERIAGMGRSEARAELLRGFREAAESESLQLARQIKDEARRNAEREAKRILSLAIQRCAAEHVAETTVSVVHLPNEEMKGRIIGREGRNIRAFEAATGIDVVIDDTPESVVLSGFDPVRREIAKLALEKLVSDGRIHPGRIEEVVKRTQEEIADRIQEFGELACHELGIQGMHPTLVNVMGRLHYRTSYGQNVLKHTLEVVHLAGIMASELEASVKTAKRAALLHDLGKALTHEIEGSHAAISAQYARRYGETQAVVHAVEAHHYEVQPQTVEAVLVIAADAISGARPGARGDSLENYIKRLEALEEIAAQKKGVEKAYALQAGREIRVIVRPGEIDDDSAVLLSQEIAREIEAELEYPGQVKVTVIRESRAVEYAK
jgi:ribonuclease Y